MLSTIFSALLGAGTAIGLLYLGYAGIALASATRISEAATYEALKSLVWVFAAAVLGWAVGRLVFPGKRRSRSENDTDLRPRKWW